MIGKTEKYRKFVVPLVLVLAFAVTLSIGGIYAKYVKSYRDTGLIISKTMYFASDCLTEEGAAYTISDTEVTIKLMNYPDELRVSEIPVNYIISVEPNDGVDVSSNSGSLGEYDFERASVEIVISGLQRGKTYTVTAFGENGYKKTLKATFKVAPDENNLYYDIAQNEYYVLLTVWTENVTGDVTITFPDTLLPDNTDALLREVTQTQGTFSDAESFVKEYSSRTYRFFKTNEITYKKEDFTVDFLNNSVD